MVPPLSSTSRSSRIMCQDIRSTTRWCAISVKNWSPDLKVNRSTAKNFALCNIELLVSLSKVVLDVCNSVDLQRSKAVDAIFRLADDELRPGSCKLVKLESCS